MIKSVFITILGWLKLPFKNKEMVYLTLFIDELPDKLDSDVIYVLGEDWHLWSVAMLCPCGCGEVLHMSLHNEGLPKWTLSSHANGTISLHPSVWRKHGCCSHFFIEKGKIKWCKINK